MSNAIEQAEIMNMVDMCINRGKSILPNTKGKPSLWIKVILILVNYNPIKIGSFQQIRDLLGLVYAASIP